MTIEEAHNKAIKKCTINIKDFLFTMVGWRSPENGSISGPFIVTISGDAAIEVDKNGKFVDSFPAKAEYYFPWFE